MIKPLPDVPDVPDVPLKRAEIGLKAAVENVILESACEGRPIYVWSDGAVVEELRKLRVKLWPSPNPYAGLGSCGILQVAQPQTRT